jgi:L-seryl-tRNA(Ser) seleniumtransferase
MRIRDIFSRRDLFHGGALAALGGWLRPGASAAPLRIGSDIYQSIGVRPIVNCKGTFTIVSGSQSLAEVKRAMEEASRHYVHLDELMNAVGARLAEITGAEWGIVTAGCAAALTHATAACIAGADPEKMQRLPDLRGLKSEVVMPRYSRNEYDHAVRMLGIRTVEVGTFEELEAAINPKTAMIMILAGGGDEGPLGTRAVSTVAQKRGVPLIVDAAAEQLTIPNLHLGRGATMVAYSGGKCLRGPQCAGLLLGQKSLLQAAWLNSAPHHAFGRSLKVGKEEIMGMLTAVEMWVKRDHAAEWKTWESWLEEISQRVSKIDGVTTRVLQPQDLSNRSPRMSIAWDGAKLGISGQEAEKILYEGSPRIVLGGSSGSARDSARSSLTVMPYMMMPGDSKIAAEKIHAVLSNPPKLDRPPVSDAAPANVAGQWDVRLEFVRGDSEHALVLEQRGGELVGTHKGDILVGDLRGTVEGNQVRFRSSHRYEGTRLGYDFQGTAEGDRMSGEVAMGEYGTARWTAQRHRYGQPGGLVRPVKNI